MPPPLPLQIESWRLAENNAALWMRWWGYPDAVVTAGGSDGGVDVRAQDALAQVKFEAVQVGRPELQRLFGARGNQLHQALFFFTGAGYSAPAIVYADEAGIALFHYSLAGSMRPISRSARLILRRVDEREEGFRRDQQQRNIAAEMRRVQQQRENAAAAAIAAARHRQDQKKEETKDEQQQHEPTSRRAPREAENLRTQHDAAAARAAALRAMANDASHGIGENNGRIGREGQPEGQRRQRVGWRICVFAACCFIAVWSAVGTIWGSSHTAGGPLILFGALSLLFAGGWLSAVEHNRQLASAHEKGGDLGERQ